MSPFSAQLPVKVPVAGSQRPVNTPAVLAPTTSAADQALSAPTSPRSGSSPAPESYAIAPASVFPFLEKTTVAATLPILPRYGRSKSQVAVVIWPSMFPSVNRISVDSSAGGSPSFSGGIASTAGGLGSGCDESKGLDATATPLKPVPSRGVGVASEQAQIRSPSRGWRNGLISATVVQQRDARFCDFPVHKLRTSDASFMWNLEIANSGRQSTPFPHSLQ